MTTATAPTSPDETLATVVSLDAARRRRAQAAIPDRAQLDLLHTDLLDAQRRLDVASKRVADRLAAVEAQIAASEDSDPAEPTDDGTNLQQRTAGPGRR